MPQRPQQHQLEDQSRIRLKSILPKSWVFRDKSHDYGIDGEVEIFEDSGESTGLLFFVQLKSTSSLKPSVFRKVTLTFDKFDYLLSLDIPVLLVQWAESKNRLFCRWIHEVDSFSDGISTKQVSVSFSNDHLWTASTPNILASQLNVRRRMRAIVPELPLRFRLKIPKQSFCKISSARISSATRFYSNAVSDIVTMAHTDDDSFDGEIVLTSNRMSGNISMYSLAPIKYELKKRQGINEDIIAKDILYLIAAMIGRTGQHALAARIFCSLGPTGTLYRSSRLASHICAALIQSDRTMEILQFSRKLLDEREINNALKIYEISMVLNLHKISKLERASVENFFNEKIDVMKEENIIDGIADTYYYFGFFYSYEPARFSKSILYFKLAARNSGSYQNNWEMLQNAGIMLSSRGKSKVAAKLLKRARSLSDSNMSLAHYANAQLFSGDYAGAKDSFQEYLEAVESPEAEWCIKSVIIDKIIEMAGDASQDRRMSEALVDRELPMAEQHPTCDREVCERILRADACHSPAWFLLATIAEGENKPNEAAMYYLIAAVLHGSDVELWANAMTAIMSSGEALGAIPLIAEAAYVVHGEKFVRSVYEIVRRSNNEMGPNAVELENILARLFDDLSRISFSYQEAERAADVDEINIEIAHPSYRDFIVGGLRGAERFDAVTSLRNLMPFRTVKLPKHVCELLEEQFVRFEKKFGRRPGPNDPIFFDPDKDIPVPYDENRMRRETLEVMLAAEIPPELVYAFLNTGLMPSETAYSAMPMEDRIEYDAAISEYFNDAEINAYELAEREIERLEQNAE